MASDFRHGYHWFTVFPFRNGGSSAVQVGGKTYHVQNVYYFRWVAENVVPADGKVHICSNEADEPISPPGLPSFPPRVLSGDHMAKLFVLDVATGKREFSGVYVPFKYGGMFNENTHTIRIKATCNGLTAIRTYRLKDRF